MRPLPTFAKPCQSDVGARTLARSRHQSRTNQPARLAYEIALTARLIKGYSDTNKRGKAIFNRIFDNLVEGSAVSGIEAKADAIFAARGAALADPDGKNLDKALGKHGKAPQAVRAVSIRFVKSAVRKGA